MADKEAEVLPTGVAKGLAEKFYEKRKNAALEIEKFALVFQYNRYTIFKRRSSTHIWPLTHTLTAHLAQDRQEHRHIRG